MLSEAKKIEATKRYLRRTKTLAQLQALADQVWSDANETVTVTGVSQEGASTSGQVTFERLTLLAAIEELLVELSPASAPTEKPTRSIGVQVVWPHGISL